MMTFFPWDQVREPKKHSSGAGPAPEAQPPGRPAALNNHRTGSPITPRATRPKPLSSRLQRNTVSELPSPHRI